MNLAWPDAANRIRKSAIYPPLFKNAFGESVVIDSSVIAKAIAQFERTLLSYNSKYDKVLRREAYFSKEEYAGFVLANDQSMGGCLHCHVTDAHALGTTTAFSNNGLSPVYQADNYLDKGKGEVTGNVKENGLFKIPSLRNVAITSPYMHDGRLETLEEVLDFYSEGVHSSANVDSKMTEAHRGGVHLTKEEKHRIILFLHTLTDSIFMTTPAFANPFLPQ
jgi:cytochrome c peroxidase